MRRILACAVSILGIATCANAHTGTLEALNAPAFVGGATDVSNDGFDLTPFAYQRLAETDGDSVNWAGDDHVMALLLHGFGTRSYHFTRPPALSGDRQVNRANLEAEVNTGDVSAVPLPGSFSLMFSVLSVFVLARILAFLLALRSEQWSRDFERATQVNRLSGQYRT